MAKYGRFDPRNKKRNKDKYRSERKQSPNQNKKNSSFVSEKSWDELDYVYSKK